MELIDGRIDSAASWLVSVLLCGAVAMLKKVRSKGSVSVMSCEVGFRRSGGRVVPAQAQDHGAKATLQLMDHPSAGSCV